MRHVQLHTNRPHTIQGFVADNQADPHQALVAGVIQGACWDYKNGHSEKKRKARAWLWTKRGVFEDYCMFLGWNPEYIRRVLDGRRRLFRTIIRRGGGNGYHAHVPATEPFEVRIPRWEHTRVMDD